MNASENSFIQIRNTVFADQSSDFIIHTDPDGGITYANPVSLRALGYDTSQDALPHLQDLLHPDSITKVQTLLSSPSMTEPTPFESIALISRAQLTILLDGFLNPVLSPDGDAQGYVWICRFGTMHHDMTDAAQIWNQIMNSLTEAIVTVRRNFHVYSSNQVFQEMFGYTDQELKELPVRSLLVEPLRDDQIALLLRRCRAGKTWIQEFPVRRKDGTSFICECKINPIKGKKGATRGYAAIMRDVTNRNRTIRMLQESHNRFNNLAHLSGSIAWEVDMEGLFTYVSPSAHQVLGYRTENLVNRLHFFDIIAESHRAELTRDAFIAFEQKESFSHFVAPMQKADGALLYMSTHGMPIMSDEGEMVGFRGLTIDITEKYRMEQMLFREKEMFRTTLLSVAEGVASTDADGRIVLMNSVAEKLTGWTQEEAAEKNFKTVFPIVDARNHESPEYAVEMVLKTGRVYKPDTGVMLMSRDGTLIPVERTASPIIDRKGRVSGVVVVFRDITERLRRTRQIDYLNSRDALTGLFNRRHVTDEIHRLDAPENLPLTVMVLDVNGLKLANDAFGHEMGDRLLCAVARILREVARPEDIIGRVGGDEFYVLLPNSDEAKAQEAKEQILEAAFNTKLDSIIVSLAIGYATKTDPDDPISTAIYGADNNMYRNKLKYGRAMRSQTIENVLRNINSRYVQEQIHTERVSDYCEAIAIAMNLDERGVQDAKVAGSLHDIGKIMVPPALLNRSEPIGEEDFEVIRRHPETGYQILRSVEEYTPLAESVLYHHERWDGYGYPEGIAGEQIPLTARIIAVADSFEAMTANRPYQKTLSVDEAREELRRCAGTQFDPDVVKAFLERIK